MKKNILLLFIFIFIFIFILLLTGCAKKTYIVTFYNDDGTKLSSVVVNEGDNISAYGTPEKEGYIFVSWIKDGIKYDETNEINDDIDLMASYVLIPEVTKTYTVTFDFGDNDLRTISVKENELVSKPTDPVKNKYKFLGWYLEDNLYDFDIPVTSDFTLVAKYEINMVKVNFVLNGGSGTVETEIVKGSKLDIDNPTKFGYNFTYWTLNGEYFSLNTLIYEDITLTANWEPKVYLSVKFDTDGGTVVLSKFIEYGYKISSVNTPKKDGYVFKYWTLNGEYFDMETVITENIVLKAYYEEVQEDN